MTKDDEKYRNDLEFFIRQENGHRVEVGLHAFKKKDGLLTIDSNRFKYADCVAVAALIIEGTDASFAAALVDDCIAYASPHIIDRGVEAPDWSDKVGQMFGGVFRLADGSLWALNFDNDYRCVKADHLDSDYLVVATRGGSITSEPVEARVRHLLTKCDEVGRPL